MTSAEFGRRGRLRAPVSFGVRPMPCRKVFRLIAKPRICECGDQAFVSLTGPWLTFVDAADAAVLAVGKWTAQPDVTGVVYATRTEARKKIRLHRRVMKVGASERVDHRDRNGLDNRRSNLRSASSSQNQCNAAARKGSSRFKGVSWKPIHESWAARITLSGSTKHLGYFKSELDAARAYDAAAIKLHGEFARINGV